MRVHLLTAAAALSLAACGRTEAPASDPGVARDEQAAAAPTGQAPAAAPLDAAPAFVGVWAASPDLCEGGAWNFGAARLSTAGEVSCDWSRVEETATGWTLQGDCAAEGAAEPATVELVRQGDGAAMALTVSGEPFSGPVTLRRCNRMAD
jgi:hypothetical protein